MNCHDAGTQPLKPADLNAGLDNNSAVSTSPQTGQSETLCDTLVAIDLAMFENTQQLLGSSFPEIVNSILSDIDNTLEKLSSWTDPLDIDGFALLPHSMKSTSAYIGAKKLNQLATACESDARGGNIEQALSYLNEMKMSYESVINDLTKLGYKKPC